MIPILTVGRTTNAEPRGECERRATGMPVGRVKRGGGRGRVAALLAVGLAVAALLAAGPAHAQQTPIVPDLSGKAFGFHWGAYRGGVWTILAQGYLAVHGVDVYTGNFIGFVAGPSDRSGIVIGQYLPEGALSFSLKFTVSLPTDLWTYTGILGKLEDGRWVVDGSFAHQDPRDPDFFEDGRWQGFEQF